MKILLCVRNHHLGFVGPLESETEVPATKAHPWVGIQTLKHQDHAEEECRTPGRVVQSRGFRQKAEAAMSSR